MTELQRLPFRKPRTRCWRVLATLLYGEQAWLHRLPHGYLSIPTGLLAANLEVKPEYLREDLRYLEYLGLISELNIHDNSIVLKIKQPKDTAWILPCTDDKIIYQEEKTICPS